MRVNHNHPRLTLDHFGTTITLTFFFSHLTPNRKTLVTPDLKRSRGGHHSSTPIPRARRYAIAFKGSTLNICQAEQACGLPKQYAMEISPLKGEYMNTLVHLPAPKTQCTMRSRIHYKPHHKTAMTSLRCTPTNVVLWQLRQPQKEASSSPPTEAKDRDVYDKATKGGDGEKKDAKDINLE